jgi:hypothetical protein
MKKSILIKEFPLANTKEGKISISHIEEPYGENSKPVVSIGISLNGENVDWKAHIPYENIDDVIAALKEAKEKYSN